jgi:hypothetical protein
LFYFFNYSSWFFVYLMIWLFLFGLLFHRQCLNRFCMVSNTQGMEKFFFTAGIWMNQLLATSQSEEARLLSALMRTHWCISAMQTILLLDQYLWFCLTAGKKALSFMCAMSTTELFSLACVLCLWFVKSTCYLLCLGLTSVVGLLAGYFLSTSF